MDEDVEVVDSVTDDEKTDNYLNEILTESQEIKEEPDEFVKNREGVTGDEWKEEEQEKLTKQIKEENKKNAERRIREKQEKEQEKSDERLEDKDLDRAELEQYRERNKELEERLGIASPVIDYLVQNRIGQRELEIGVDFVNHWRTDRVGAVKKLLNALERDGIDIGQIVTHDDTQLRVMQGINQRMQPIMQQRAEEVRMAESRKLLDGFLAKYPDAWEHLEEITEVMKRSGEDNPYRAYFKLRRTYTENNQSWFPEEQVDIEEKPMVNSQTIQTSYSPQNYKSIEDVVASEARKIFRR